MEAGRGDERRTNVNRRNLGSFILLPLICSKQAFLTRPGLVQNNGQMRAEGGKEELYDADKRRSFSTITRSEVNPIFVLISRSFLVYVLSVKAGRLPNEKGSSTCIFTTIPNEIAEHFNHIFTWLAPIVANISIVWVYALPGMACHSSVHEQQGAVVL